MNIYKISQNINTIYENYDSAIVCAKSKKDARTIHPENFDWSLNTDDWVSKDMIDKIKVEFIGKAGKNIKRGAILASFNAG